MAEVPGMAIAGIVGRCGGMRRRVGSGPRPVTTWGRPTPGRRRADRRPPNRPRLLPVQGRVDGGGHPCFVEVAAEELVHPGGLAGRVFDDLPVVDVEYREVGVAGDPRPHAAELD